MCAGRYCNDSLDSCIARNDVLVLLSTEIESGRTFCASYVWRQQKGCFMKLKIYIALLLTLAPVIAQAKPRSTSVHTRPQLYHDRAPKVRSHDYHMREERMKASQSPTRPTSQNF